MMIDRSNAGLWTGDDIITRQAKKWKSELVNCVSWKQVFHSVLGYYNTNCELLDEELTIKEK